ncbi:STE24 endopeptidase [Tremella mesenterica]|uniref:CAAX prenyl protease n=1 Tax=Tremella mesenterica TaxID=5217 RepID=A0A4Q1BVP7_TREME|nr:uncharacterized protein TREMEDRAFT_39579 [Tremella mesenterica DSM 1558]EIW68672.1 hypothetical protein TREMEDRAFT_39579 [Tremella mesenterica DSM 1558]RXK42188.1 STE24 endopeptidase [Tremella mesenterica]
MTSFSPLIWLDKSVSHLASLADDPSIDWKNIVVACTWLQTAFEVYLYSRQLRCYSLPSPPPEIKDHLDSTTFSKAQKYGKDKCRLELLKTVWSQLLSWGLISGGFYVRAWGWSGELMRKFGLSEERVITHSLIWFTILSLFPSLLSLPWEYYRTFVIEERHGFNKSSVGLWIKDQLVTYSLVGVIGLPLLAGLLRIIGWAGRAFVPWLMVFLISIQLLLQIIFPTFIQPLFNKLTPLPEGELRTMVESLAKKLNFPLTHLYQIDGSKRSSHSNAYFYGLPWSKHIVIYDTLIEKSTPTEVEAVLSHELGHWYFSHPTKLLIAAQFHILLNISAFLIFMHNKSLYSSFGFDPRLASPSLGQRQPVFISFVLYQMVLDPLDTIVKFFLNAQTRKYEYQADEFGVQLGKKDALCSSLIKLHVTNLSSPHNDWLYSMYHHSHPVLPERLRAMDNNKSTPLKLKGEKEL